MNNASLSYLSGNTIELHYWFNKDDSTHTMDALIQNKCEFELLQILKEIAQNFNLEIIIETEPLAEGGLRRWFTIVKKEENRKAVITTALIVSFASTVLFSPITTALTETTKHIIDNIFEDKEIKNLQEEKLKEEIINLKLDAEIKVQQLSKNNIIIKRRSNFFEALEKYPKVEKVSIIIENKEKQPITKEIFISQINFKEYIIVSDDLQPIQIENAIIEIISPVLKKGNYKWRGIYNGETVSFNMKSPEFKTLVQTGKIEFKNGFSIKCNLEIERKLNNNGEEFITNYNITSVLGYFVNDKPMETNEGIKYRRQQEADKRQLSLLQNPEFIKE